MNKKYLIIIPLILLVVWYFIHQRCESCQQKWAEMKKSMMGGSDENS